MGEATHDVRPAAGLGPLAGVLAARHPPSGPGHQLGPRARVTEGVELCSFSIYRKDLRDSHKADTMNMSPMQLV